MPIFRYTFKKMITIPSTLIIFLSTLIFLTLSWSLIPLIISDYQQVKLLTYDQALSSYLPQWKNLSFSILLAIMIFIFIAVKVTQVFRDEIDDGTLLILVSKPISRTRIWIEKLLSLQIIIILYLFLSIFIASFAIIATSSTTIYRAIFPYLAILFAVGIVFAVIISAIAILFSLILNAKATITIMIAMTAIFNIFASINDLVTINGRYYHASQSLAVYNNIKTKITADDINWINKYRTNINKTKEEISNAIKDIYATYITTTITYPNNYDYLQEQKAVLAIVNGDKPPLTNAPKELVTHIYHIASAFRQWQAQSFEELMTGNHVGWENDINKTWYDHHNHVNYAVITMIDGLNTHLSPADYDDINTQITKVKAMRYLNIFYQLKYIWEGITTNKQNLIFTNPSTYQYIADPYLVNFIKITNDYQLDTNNTTNKKIINFSALLTIYILFGIGLLTVSLLVFNRQDFT